MPWLTSREVIRCFPFQQYYIQFAESFTKFKITRISLWKLIKGEKINRNEHTCSYDKDRVAVNIDTAKKLNRTQRIIPAGPGGKCSRKFWVDMCLIGPNWYPVFHSEWYTIPKNKPLPSVMFFIFFFNRWYFTTTMHWKCYFSF